MSMSIPNSLSRRRSVPPEETVRRIKLALDRIGIATFERERTVFKDWCFSVEVGIQGLEHVQPECFAAGKGPTRELALASGYGELIEYLQNTNSLVPAAKLPARFGLMPGKLAKPPDAARISVETLFRDSPLSMGSLLESRAGEMSGVGDVECLPFLNASTGQVDHLPANLIWQRCRNTGMAAGNTMEEAITQSLCEIMERYVQFRVFSEAMRVPTIPLGELTNLQSHELIRRIEDDGYTVLIKDCTLGGRFPVLASVIIDPVRSLYVTAFASDPDLDICVQRVLLEILQIVMNGDLRSVMLPLRWQGNGVSDDAFASSRARRLHALKLIGVPKTHFVNSIFVDAGHPSYEEAFIRGSYQRQGALHHALQRLRVHRRQVYVRDVSFLGFPAVYSYIPGMSERYPVEELRLSDDPREKEAMNLRHSMLNLGRASKESMETMAVRLADHLRGGGRVNCPEWFGVMVDDDSDTRSVFELDYLAALLHCRVGEFREAFEWMHTFIDRTQMEAGPGVENRLEASCALAFLKFLSLDMPIHRAEKSLAGIYGEATAKSVVEDIMATNVSLGYLQLPICGDCAKCPARESCRYDDWHRLVKSIGDEMVANAINQEENSRLLS